MPWFAFAIFLVFVSAAACNETPVPTQPSVPQTSTTSVQPPKFYSLEGRVHDSFFEGLPDALVEAIDGPLTGTTTRTDQHGTFTLPGEFSEAITIRASKDGLSPATKRVSLPEYPIVGSRLDASLELTPLNPPVDLAGAYTFTVETTACTGIPESLKVREYSVTLVPYTNAFSFRMNFNNPGVFDAWNPAVEIRVVGSRIQMNIGDWGGGVIEDFPTAWLTFFGSAQATLEGSGVSGSFGGGGGLMYCPAPRAERGTSFTTWNCPANDTTYCEGELRYSLKRR